MKKFFNIILIISVTLFCLTGFCFENMKRNSVYYAKHTPHKEDTKLVLMMVVDNLEWIYNPEIDGIEYDFDGYNCIKNYNFKSEDGLYFASFGGERYSYDSNDECYNFNSDFELTYCSDRHYKKIDIKNIDVEEVKKDIYKMAQPVIDAQSKPRVNLQWLFDIVYKDRFN